MEFLHEFTCWTGKQYKDYIVTIAGNISELSKRACFIDVTDLIDESDPIQYRLNDYYVTYAIKQDDPVIAAEAWMCAYICAMFNDRKIDFCTSWYNPMSMTASSLFFYDYHTNELIWKYYDILSDAAKLYIESL